MARPKTAYDRFWDKVDVFGYASCWEWKGSKTDGYGQFMVDGVTVQVHRWSYERAMGAIPVGLQLDHLCHNRGCVNPLHLEPVTQAENIRRGNGGWNHRNKTHCHRGHRFTPDNTYVRNGKWRECRTCWTKNGKKDKETVVFRPSKNLV